MKISVTVRKDVFFTATVILLVALSLMVVLSSRGKPSVVATNLEKLPMSINGMQGIEDSFPDTVYLALNADVSVYRHYRSAQAGTLSLYIGYYGTAKGGRTFHEPMLCMPSQGWALLESRDVMLLSKHYGRPVPANYLLATKEGQRLITIYWYQSAGTEVLSSGISQNIQRFMNLVLHNRNDGAFVRVTCQTSSIGSKFDSEYEMSRSFAEEVLNLLPNYWPVED